MKKLLGELAGGAAGSAGAFATAIILDIHITWGFVAMLFALGIVLAFISGLMRA